jgi:hypothetical protein
MITILNKTLFLGRPMLQARVWRPLMTAPRSWAFEASVRDQNALKKAENPVIRKGY